MEWVVPPDFPPSRNREEDVREQMPPLQGTWRDSKVHAGLLGRETRMQTLLSYPAPHLESVEHLALATRDPSPCHQPSACLLAVSHHCRDHHLLN